MRRPELLVVVLLVAWAAFCAGAPDPVTAGYFWLLGFVVVQGTFIAWRADHRGAG